MENLNNNSEKIDITKSIDNNLTELEKRINEKLESLNSTGKIYSYEKNENETFSILVNGIKYDGKEYRTGEELISAIKIIDSILKIYMENGSKNEFYLKNDGIDFIDIYLDDSIIPFRDTKYLTQETFTKHFGKNIQDIEKFVQFLNKVNKTEKDL